MPRWLDRLPRQHLRGVEGWLCPPSTRLSNRLKTFLIRLGLGSDIHPIASTRLTVRSTNIQDTQLRWVKARGGPWRWGLNGIWPFALSLYGYPAICSTLYVLMNSGRQPFLYL